MATETATRRINPNMENVFFHSLHFNKIQDINSMHEEEEIATAAGKAVPWFKIDQSGQVNSFCSEPDGLFQENMAAKRANLFQNLDQTHTDFFPNGMPLLAQPAYESENPQNVPPKISELEQMINANPSCPSPASLELLANDGTGFSKTKEQNLTSPNDEKMVSVASHKLSTEEILRIAGERYVQISTSKINAFTVDERNLRVAGERYIHPYGSALSGLSMEETRDVELSHLLLAAADKVCSRQLDCASKLLSGCECLASNAGTSVQRLAFYFAAGLRQRIERERGIAATAIGMIEQPNHGNKAMPSTDLAFLAAHQELPFSKAMQLAGMQAIIENVERASKVHLIDLDIRSGIQWTILMQALSENYNCQILKITALATKDKPYAEEIGKRLQCFAESFNLPFSFKVVSVSDMKDLKEEQLQIGCDETVAVYASLILRAMISRPDGLETLMRVIRKIRPSVMVVIEVEANHNSPSFINRFIEALFFYGTLLDCLEDCMDRDNQYRRALEANYLGEGIKNMVSTEGEERFTRNVKIDVWRSFFARFRMLEVELSESSLYQANLVLRQFAPWSSCTLVNDGKALIIGWKGTPLHSVSTWKFI